MKTKKLNHESVNQLAVKIMQAANAEKEDHNHTLYLLEKLRSAISAEVRQ